MRRMTHTPIGLWTLFAMCLLRVTTFARRSPTGQRQQPTIGKIVDDAMVAIEPDNPRLKGVLAKDYGPTNAFA